ncbi:hypothetical protein AB4156_38825 [Cupriavidus sp. 2MCAB6]|uniref:hypothetical protein n=1 Tax=Cupriavidus sp. 2MCAB6 TaxID=3232981 RepID=UPI003F904187
MLSPHEFATLMLVHDTQDRLELDPVDLEALLERGLVSLEECGAGHWCPHVTPHGFALLRAMGWQGDMARVRHGASRGQEASAR